MQAAIDAAGSNPAEMLVDVREGFEQLEDAISMGDAARCRPYVSDQLYAQVSAMVADLRARGDRRVHGSFEIVDASIVDVEPGQPSQVRIHASSSIMELDATNKIVSGSTDLMAWRQDLSVAYVDTPAEHRWIITALGELTVDGNVTGPAGQPMDPLIEQELEDRNRERQEEADADVLGPLHRSQVSLMSFFQYHPF